MLGDPGCGKSRAMREIVRRYVIDCPRGVALVCDDKEARPQYDGQLYRDPDDLERRPPQPEPRVVVFRGVPFSLSGLDYEKVASLQLRLAQQRVQSMVVYDELDRAAANGQWKEGKESKIAWALGKGRSQGAASLWGTQQTQAVPREAFDCSSSILCFRMMGAPLRLLRERGYCEGGVDEVIPILPGDELPPAQRGFFVLLRRGRPWDRKIYRFA